MSYVLIARDMDETLLNDRHEICQKNIDVIIRAKKEFGVKFVPATGRRYLSIQHNLKTLGLYDAIQDITAVCDYSTKADNNEGVIAELIEKFIFNQ